MGTRWIALSVILAVVAILVSGYVLVRLLTLEPAPSASVTVPDLVGRTLDDARAIAETIGLDVVPKGQVSEGRPIGTVLSQEPGAGAVVARGSTVAVTIATAPDLVTVPDLRGVPESNALRLLSAAGLTVGSRTEASDQLVIAGSIIRQDPPAGVEAPRGTPVGYVVSTGPLSSPTVGPSPSTSPTPEATASPPTGGSIVVGDYRCLTLVDATTRLKSDGLSLGTVSYSIEGGAVDDTWIVDRQDPPPGARRPPAATVNLLLASPFSTCLD